MQKIEAKKTAQQTKPKTGDERQADGFRAYIAELKATRTKAAALASQPIRKEYGAALVLEVNALIMDLEKAVEYLEAKACSVDEIAQYEAKHVLEYEDLMHRYVRGTLDKDEAIALEHEKIALIARGRAWSRKKQLVEIGGGPLNAVELRGKTFNRAEQVEMNAGMLDQLRKVDADEIVRHFTNPLGGVGNSYWDTFKTPWEFGLALLGEKEATDAFFGSKPFFEHEYHDGTVRRVTRKDVEELFQRRLAYVHARFTGQSFFKVLGELVS